MALLTGSPLSGPLGYAAGIGFIAFLLVGYPGTPLLEHLMEQNDQLRSGQAGEQKVRDVLHVSLPHPWVLIHNMEWPERKWGDVDLILIGTGGVWAFEVKAYTTPTRNLGERWQYKSRWGWRNHSKSPGKQAKDNARKVKDYLDLHGVNVKWVNPIVVWAGDDTALTIEDPAVPVWRLSELSERIEELWRGQKLDEAEIQKCVEILEEALNKVKAKQDSKKT